MYLHLSDYDKLRIAQLRKQLATLEQLGKGNSKEAWDIAESIADVEQDL